ncbi:MAG: Membrane-associated protein containing RNA-binding TRAM domain and ribonuclease PIN-domain, YacL B.subtilis ortholog [uncultured Phycisphaerae bacterium]|uniref:Membrane-associated protein containing RNA-binding TRAM domain and ribonuclease PIN-domain, YacL B.subtilis ortholog n=1 Tax=uncultured Phycisphaerae bacterium TaxID=904963 RepID=A0A6J4QAW2_9BACT|nr:MAG: Membrane-associated protein containing RNA-binding TRAM domain and ribonuclease PIN-domain, YacL B.subtilis ortholog [uncultured Phycisphaerae bacterium]
MVLHVVRGLFILLLAAVGWFYLQLTWLAMAIALSIGVLFVCLDIVSPRRKLAVFSGVLFGLVVGILIAYGLSFAVALVVDQAFTLPEQYPGDPMKMKTIEFAKMVVAVVTCYLTVSFTLQTKDDFRFIIPYVEFTKSAKGARPFLLDTSALIDGRIADVVDTGVIDTQLVVPRFVLQELQDVADSGDKLKRNRGRRGLDVLAKLRNAGKQDVVMYEPHDRGQPGAADLTTDEKLIDLATELNARVLTTDYNLNKVAQLRGVEVINLNDLAKALKPTVLPGERMTVRLVKPGESGAQGVGYLDDGTMVVVEQGRNRLNEEVEFTVTSALQTSAGRMIFGRLADPASAAAGPRKAAPEPEPAT